MDELNILRTEKVKKEKSLPYEQYFGEMELTDKQLRERLLFSLMFESAVLIAFSRVELNYKYGDSVVPTDKVVTELAQKYEEVYSEFANLDDEIKAYIFAFATSVVNTTLKHIADSEDDNYFTSYDRARLVTENEANTSLNFADYKKAIESGHTKKTWRTMRDNLVRETHMEVDKETIPIDAYFLVGDSMMRYPKDMNGINVTANETVNCRCTIQYS